MSAETVVRLSDGEKLLATWVGSLRQYENDKAGRTHVAGASNSNGYARHVAGAAAELAFAKWAGLYWSGMLELGAVDVDPFEVRYADGASRPLPVRPKDSDESLFVLVVPEPAPATYRVVGYLYGHEAKLETYWATPQGRPGAFFVPQTSIHPLDRGEVLRLVDESRR